MSWLNFPFIATQRLDDDLEDYFQKQEAATAANAAGAEAAAAAQPAATAEKKEWIGGTAIQNQIKADWWVVTTTLTAIEWLKAQWVRVLCMLTNLHLKHAHHGLSLKAVQD